jgi:glycosyltransferase involved in cell wall biosynthesis
VKRVLVVSNDYVGETMAGPGIRYYHFAKELGKRFDVTLMTPNAAQVDLDGVTVRHAARLSHREFKGLLKRFDVVIAQKLGPREMKFLAQSEQRTVYDLYDPLMMENLPLFSSSAEPRAQGDAAYRLTNLSQKMAVATGDAFICASERQRDLWLGVLAAAGRIDLGRYERDRTLRTLIDVVPFGLEAETPRATKQVLRGVVPGIRENDKLLLWGGGVWSWLDPLSVVRAVKTLSAGREDVKLIFLGIDHPNPDVARMAMTDEAIALSRDLGVLDRFVFFQRGWVPYRERASYLLEADLGVSSHFDTVETHFAFRTRLLDYFWAGLPVVTTRGDVLSDLVERRRLGRTVGFGDVDGWARAISELLDDRDEYRQAQANVERVRSDFAWPHVVEPLAALVSAPPARAPSSARSTAMIFAHWSLRARISLARRGFYGSVVRLRALAAAKGRETVRRSVRASALRRLG